MTTNKDKGEERYFVLAFRTGMDAIENTVVSAAEIPLSVLSGLGVSEETTDAARKANIELADGIRGTVDTVVTQITDAVARDAALAADIVGEAAKKVSSK